jgi:hypothetical protein
MCNDNYAAHVSQITPHRRHQWSTHDGIAVTGRLARVLTAPLCGIIMITFMALL